MIIFDDIDELIEWINTEPEAFREATEDQYAILDSSGDVFGHDGR